MLIRVLDLETTGFEPTCGVVEIGAYDFKHYLDDEIIAPFEETLVNPGMPIPPAASGCHHLCDEDVQEAPDWDSTLPRFWREPTYSALTTPSSSNSGSRATSPGSAPGSRRWSAFRMLLASVTRSFATGSARRVSAVP
jgi:hypothetical protein